MTKMREAFEAWCNSDIPPSYHPEQQAFEAGYQAAIAAVKEGGPVAYGDRLRTHLQCAYVIPLTGVPPWMANMKPLYKLPEDDTPPGVEDDIEHARRHV